MRVRIVRLQMQQVKHRRAFVFKLGSLIAKLPTMSEPQEAKPAKLVIGLLLNNKNLLPEVAGCLEHDFGNIDMASNWMDFDYTDYYASEMGQPIYRRVLSFKGLFPQKELSRVKLQTNRLEASYAVAGRRCANIDPGYLLYARFVLATGKDYAHRIYIGSGIYADLTLIYQKGTFQSLPWTYPDYGDAKMVSFLTQVRHKYGAELRRLEP